MSATHASSATKACESRSAVSSARPIEAKGEEQRDPRGELAVVDVGAGAARREARQRAAEGGLRGDERGRDHRAREHRLAEPHERHEGERPPRREDAVEPVVGPLEEKAVAEGLRRDGDRHAEVTARQRVGLEEVGAGVDGERVVLDGGVDDPARDGRRRDRARADEGRARHREERPRDPGRERAEPHGHDERGAEREEARLGPRVAVEEREPHPRQGRRDSQRSKERPAGQTPT